MKRPLPRTPASWLKEIKLAIADAMQPRLCRLDEQQAEKILIYCEEKLE